MNETGEPGFGSALRRWRELSGLTQLQLAARLSYHHSFISRLESGRRSASRRLAEQLDEVLGTGGELSGLLLDTRRAEAADLGFALHGSQAEVELPEGWPGRVLPLLGLTCPLHGTDDCAPTAEPTVPIAGDRTVHQLMALLRIYTTGYMESTVDGAAVAVEARTHAILRQARDLGGRDQAHFLHLAASYASPAGELRSKFGQYGQAMAWLQRGMQWGTAAGNLPAVVRILAQMSTIARLEAAPEAAADYAHAQEAVDRRRKWTVVDAQLHLARASACRGDLRGFEHYSAVAQRLAAEFDERDRAEAPWLCGNEGTTFIHSFLAGGLRDLTAQRTDRALARRAATCAGVALETMPAYMRPSWLMLRLRLADAKARAGDIDEAAATARPVLNDARTCGLALVRHELRHLRSSLPAVAAAREPTDQGAL